MEKVLISACLVGENTKYNGKNNYCKDIEKLRSLCDLILICPEVMGGLPTPRSPSEIKNHQVINKANKDVTKFFKSGANLASYIARENNVKYALLKENSPSCGVHHVYDGSFTSSLVKGQGITTQELTKLNIQVFSEKEINQLIELLK